MVTILTSILSFILAIFPLVVLHEFGHYIVGKFLGAEPEEFSMGFGKKIWGFKWDGTLFKISWIPLGGYVKFKKSQFDIEFGEGKKTGGKISAWRWFFISIAGPITNFVLTIAILGGMMFHVSSNLETGVNAEGNKIISVGAMSPSLKKAFIHVPDEGKTFEMKNGSYIPYSVKPEDKLSPPTLSKKLMASLTVGPSYIITGSVETIKALGKLVSTTDGYKNVMGPVGIAKVSDEAREEGFVSFLFLLSSLSFAVGFFNILPLAPLDGGRALFAVYETVTRRTISLKALGLMNTISLVLVLNLMVMGLFSDFTRLWK